MRKPWQVWMAFTLGVAVVLTAMGWLTAKALELDAAQDLARRELDRARRRADLGWQQAEQQELVGKALWRMDWTLMPLVAQEASRPYYVYQPFLPGRQGGKLEMSRIASPLLVHSSEYVVLHFEVDEQGNWSSPQIPAENYLASALQCGVTSRQVSVCSTSLAELTRVCSFETLIDSVPDRALPTVAVPSQPWDANLNLNFDSQNTANWGAVVDNGIQVAEAQQVSRGYQVFQQEDSDPEEVPNASQSAEIPLDLPNQERSQSASPLGQGSESILRPESQRAAPERQVAGPTQTGASQRAPLGNSRSGPTQNDWLQRNRGFQAYAQALLMQQRIKEPTGGKGDPLPASDPVREGVSRPFWLGEKLILARRVLTSDPQRGERVTIQGCWLDWKRIRQALLDEVQDLLPDADLQPIQIGSQVVPGRTLATLPVQIVVPRQPTLSDSPAEMSSWSAIRVSLLIAWLCLVLATAAAGILLQGVVQLSERRAAFVSAVTHELRTPLTTFRMYAEMLAENMVPQPDQRKAYLETLRLEADRLAHLVENVLQYARLERGGTRRQCQTISVGSLHQQCWRRLAERAAQSGMKLELELPAELESDLVETDPSAVEQILFNLVDNACKYAASAEDFRVHLMWRERAGALEAVIRDHGPGIPADRARRLFRPFSKSVHEAACTAPGVGLGLALSQRLARQLGGDLTYSPAAEGGAGFILRFRP